MIYVNHSNTELKTLIEKGKSNVYGKLAAKKTFLKSSACFLRCDWNS